MWVLLAALSLLWSVVSVVASPTPVSIAARDAITSILDPSSVLTLTSSEISAFEPYEQLARAAYCASDIVTGWQCGGK